MNNERITRAAWSAAALGMPGLPDGPGFCLQAVRVIVEAALKLESREMYTRWLIAGTTRRGGTDRERLAAAKLDPWASDFEASVKRLGWGVPFSERQAGDLLFDHNAAPPYGHVGILLDRDTLLESIDPKFRPTSLHLGHGSLSLTPIWERKWTLAARVHES